jgi:hypothetical protein
LILCVSWQTYSNWCDIDVPGFIINGIRSVTLYNNKWTQETVQHYC